MAGELECRVQRLETIAEGLAKNFDGISHSIEKIGGSLETLTRLEVHHADTREGLNRCFTEIEKNEQQCIARQDKQDARIREIETALPELKTTSRWVKMGVIAVVGAAFALVWFSAIDHMKQPAPVQEVRGTS